MVKSKLTDICGTRYHRVSIIDKDECLFVGIISTPLNKKELQQFITNRVGYATCTVFSSEISAPETDDKYAPNIMGLSTFEKVLVPFVPEKVISEETIKVTVTNKGISIKNINKRIDPETGEIKGDE